LSSIAADASVALADAETAEPANFEFVPGLERFDYAIEQRIDNDL